MNLFELFVKIGVDDQASGKLSDLSNKLGNGLKTAAKIGTAAVATAATGITALTTAAVNNYAEYEQLVGGVETLFKGSADTVQKYAESAYKTAGLSANEYMSTVTSFSASLLQSLGGDTEEAAKYADTAVTDMADNANKMGTSIDMLQNAYSGFAKQNFTMLDNLKLGYGGTKEEMQRLLDDAEKLSGVEYDISSFADITEAIHVMQEEMGIAGATALEAGTTIEGSVNSMKGAWQNLITGLASGNADIGQLVDNLVTTIVGDGTESNLGVLGNIIPAIETALGGAGTLIEEVVPEILEKLPELINEVLPMLLDSASSLIGSLLQSLPTIISTLLPVILEAIQSVISMLMEELPTILSTLLPILIDSAVSLISMLASQLPSVLQILVDILPSLIEQLSGALVELAPILIDAIVQSIPIVLSGLLSALPQILKAIISLAESIAKSLPTVIKTITAMLPNLIKTICDVLLDNLPVILDGIISVVGLILEELPSIITMITDMIPEIIETLMTTLIEALPTIISSLVELVGMIAVALPEIFASLISGAADIFSSIWDNIKEVFSLEKVEEFFGEILNGITEALGSVKEWFSENFGEAWASVEEAFAKVGEFFGEVWSDITGAFSEVGKWFGDIFSEAWRDIEDAFASVGDFFSGIWSDITGAFDSVVTWFSDTFSDAWEAVEDAFDSVGEFFSDLWSDITEVFTDIGTEVGEAVSNAFSEAVNWVLDTAIGLINGFIRTLNKAIGLINKLPGVEISKIKEIEVPQLARGGIVNDPTLALIGERGSEAIIPLENNRGWIREISEELGRQMFGTSNEGFTNRANIGTININITGVDVDDPERLADVIADRLNERILRQEAVYA